MTAMTATEDPAEGYTRRHFADLLVRLRGGTTRAEMARRLGVSRQAVMELEKAGGPSNPTLKRIEELASAYGVRFEVVAVNDAGDVVLEAPALRAVDDEGEPQ